MKRMVGVAGIFLVLVLTSACRSTYYAAWEKMGKYKRDLLKDDVQKVREGQQAAADQFKDALTRLRELYHFEGGDLEKTYDQLKTEYDRSKARADNVRTRIKQVE